jgi:hypothetical protein
VAIRAVHREEDVPPDRPPVSDDALKGSAQSLRLSDGKPVLVDVAVGIDREPVGPLRLAERDVELAARLDTVPSGIAGQIIDAPAPPPCPVE